MYRALPLLIPALVACADRTGAPTAATAPAPVAAPAAVAAVHPAPRLGDAVVPAAYELDFELDPERPDFAGRVRIDLEVREPVGTVWLHAEELSLGAMSLEGPRGAVVIEEVEQTASGLLGLHLADPLAPGPARLDLAFRGRLGTRVGLFRQRQEGRWYVFSDFEPIDARRAFPGFDDPRFKTPWRVTLTIPGAAAGYANAPLVEAETLADGRRRLRFAPTRPLPTYLVAVAVGPFDELAADVDGVPVRILGPRGRLDRGRLALAMLPDLLRLIRAYLDRPVPFAKLDFVAVPSFDGAMENPGLITISEDILLPRAPSLRQRRLLAMVLAHELAHLWFGDLVTLAYWDELWLNEGLATWLTDRTLAAYRPDWATRVDEVVAKHEAMVLDLPPRVLRGAVHERDDIGASFDAIAYKKGGALAAQLEADLGPEVFGRGLRAYLDAHQDGTATTAALLTALGRAAGRDLGGTTSFLDQAGVPLVEARLHCEGEAATVELTQRPYDGHLPGAGALGRTWDIPVCVRWDDGGTPRTRCTRLRGPRATLALEAARCPGWIYPNAGEDGYYYLELAPELLRAAAASGALDQRELTGLVHQVRALLAAGRLTLPEALEVLEPVTRAGERHALEALAELVQRVADHLLDDPAREARFAAWVRAHLGPRARALGLTPSPGEDEERTLLRPTLLRLAGVYGADPGLTREARKLAERWLRGGAAADEELWPVLLAVAASHADAGLVRRLAARLEVEARAGSHDAATVTALAYALGSLRAPDLARQAMALEPGAVGERTVLRIRSRYAVRPELRADALAGLSSGRRAMVLAAVMSELCDLADLAPVEEVVRAILEEPAGRRRLLASLRANVGRCQLLRQHHQEPARRHFAHEKAPSP